MNWYKIAKTKSHKNLPEFSYGDETRDMWRTLIKEEQKRSQVNFDLENDDAIEGKIIPLSYKHDDDSYRAIVHKCAAGGDWESPVTYFQCQIECSYDNGTYSPKFKTIIIPINGNLNLTKSNKGYTAKQGDDYTKLEPKDEKILWEEVEKELNKRIKTQWENLDYDKGDVDVFQISGLIGSLLKLYPSK